MSEPIFDTRAFRNALGSFTTGVTIVTARGLDGEPIGVTANSFNSVSLEPPMILWSLARNARSLAAFEGATHWVVHILAADQESLSNRFAKSSTDKFAGLAIEAGIGGTPLLTGCACRLQCRTAFRYEGGDHVIFVGEVVDFDSHDVPTLAFHGGKYALAARKSEPAELSGAARGDLDISYGEDFLGYLLWRADLHFRLRVSPHLEEKELDADGFMILAMLLHHDGRSPAQLAPGLTEPGSHRGVVERARKLAERGWLRMEGDGTPTRLWLNEAGRDAILHIHAASQAVESELLEKLEPSEALAFKHLLRRFIMRTDSGLPHPWQDGVAKPG